jgi:5'-deoxynucleotidase YfbR-like HD superfamily hydrolase
MVVHTVPHPLSCLVLSKALRLWGIPRKGWPGRGVAVEDVEDSLQHSLTLCGISLRIPKRESGLSSVRIGLIAMLHDLDEIPPGEDEIQKGGISLPFAENPRVQQVADGFNDKRSREEKIQSAIKWLAFQAAVQDWPPSLQQEATRLYDEYRGAYTPEAKVVHQCHPLANLEMGLDYIAGVTPSGRKYPDIDLTSFWEDAYEAQSWRRSPVDLGPILDDIHDREQVLRTA